MQELPRDLGHQGKSRHARQGRRWCKAACVVCGTLTETASMTPTDDAASPSLPDSIHAPLASALAAKGYSQLTPVQMEMTGPGLREADLLVSAQTGSGKTVAFGIAIASTLLGSNDRFGAADKPLGL